MRTTKEYSANIRKMHRDFINLPKVDFIAKRFHLAEISSRIARFNL